MRSAGDPTFKKIRSVDYYCCPVCGESSTNSLEIQKHFQKHQIKVERVIYCNICGEGWYTRAYGEEEAKRRADQCCQSHIDDGSADVIARRTWLYTGGRLGYVKYVKGGREDG